MAARHGAGQERRHLGFRAREGGRVGRRDVEVDHLRRARRTACRGRHLVPRASPWPGRPPPRRPSRRRCPTARRRWCRHPRKSPAKSSCGRRQSTAPPPTAAPPRTGCRARRKARPSAALAPCVPNRPASGPEPVRAADSPWRGKLAAATRATSSSLAPSRIMASMPLSDLLSSRSRQASLVGLLRGLQLGLGGRGGIDLLDEAGGRLLLRRRSRRCRAWPARPRSSSARRWRRAPRRWSAAARAARKAGQLLGRIVVLSPDVSDGRAGQQLRPEAVGPSAAAARRPCRSMRRAAPERAGCAIERAAAEACGRDRSRSRRPSGRPCRPAVELLARRCRRPGKSRRNRPRRRSVSAPALSAMRLLPVPVAASRERALERLASSRVTGGSSGSRPSTKRRWPAQASRKPPQEQAQNASSVQFRQPSANSRQRRQRSLPSKGRSPLRPPAPRGAATSKPSAPMRARMKASASVTVAPRPRALVGLGAAARACERRRRAAPSGPRRAGRTTSLLSDLDDRHGRRSASSIAAMVAEPRVEAAELPPSAASNSPRRVLMPGAFRSATARSCRRSVAQTRLRALERQRRRDLLVVGRLFVELGDDEIALVVAGARIDDLADQHRAALERASGTPGRRCRSARRSRWPRSDMRLRRRRRAAVPASGRPSRPMVTSTLAMARLTCLVRRPSAERTAWPAWRRALLRCD